MLLKNAVLVPAPICCTRCYRWEPNTYGYHGDDGKKFQNSGSNLRQSKGTEYGPTYSIGDTVGAGLNLETQEIFFT